MRLRNIISVLLGFSSIGLLSSIFAKFQGAIYPSSLLMFNQSEFCPNYMIQLAIKILCVWISCIFGGIITSSVGGKSRELLVVGFSILLVVAWLWLSIIHPVTFWILLILGVLPSVFLGGRIVKYINSR